MEGAPVSRLRPVRGVPRRAQDRVARRSCASGLVLYKLSREKLNKTNFIRAKGESQQEIYEKVNKMKGKLHKRGNETGQNRTKRIFSLTER